MYSNLSCELKGQAAGIKTDSGRFVLTSDRPKTETRDAINLYGDSLQFCVNVRTLLDDRWDTWTSGYGSSKRLHAYWDWDSGKFSIFAYHIQLQDPLWGRGT